MLSVARTALALEKKYVAWCCPYTQRAATVSILDVDRRNRRFTPEGSAPAAL